MGIHLTSRDFKVINLLIKQGFAFSEQIQSLGFPSHIATRLRIASLVKEGYIAVDKLKVTPSMRDWYDATFSKNKNQIIYGLHNRAIYKPGPQFLTQVRKSTDRTDQMIKHQLGLNRVLEQVSRYFKNPVLLTEEDVEIEDRLIYSGNSKVFPDLVFSEGKIRLAVEYERNIKARKVYFEKWYRYQRSALYSHTLYVCENQIIFDALIKHSRNFPRLGFMQASDCDQVMTGMGWMSVPTFLGNS